MSKAVDPEIDLTFDPKSFVANLSTRPGVYRMLDADSKVIYVGKARNLKNRVGSYFRASGLATKTIAMVEKIAAIEVTLTSNETEALLLEQSLIKTYRPAYNIQLRDDKSYPYIMLSANDEYPRLGFYRGSRKRSRHKFFGPYPSAQATRETLLVLKKVFKVRQCEDSYFRNRSRPCLQHQINRCTAPCVGAISSEDYARDVHYSRLFLQGKSESLFSELTSNMEQAASAQDFERAATVRDQIIELRRIHEQQNVINQGGDADVLAAALEQPYACVQAVYVRGGRIIGTKSFYPKYKLATNESELLAAFIAQAYLSEEKSANIPAEIVVGAKLEEAEELAAALSYLANRKIKVADSVRSHRAKWLELANTNAKEALSGYTRTKQNTHKRFQLLQDALQLASMPLRIECFDISHTSGESTVASCVVFDINGAVKSDYRRFNIEGITAGDDYAAMDQALSRRYTRLAKGEAKLPDILLIDGGKGQLTQARNVLQQFQLPEIQLLGIAKGISRRAGQETLFLETELGHQEIVIDTDSPALHLLQQVRDEAHRFAITGHRQRRSKTRQQSSLEQIPGLGPKRRRALLRHFGGQQEIARSSSADLAKVEGISIKLAENIYAFLHNE